MGGFRSRSESARAGTQVEGINKGYKTVQRKKQFSSAPARKRRAADLPRTIAFEVIHDVTQNDAYANLILPKKLRSARLSSRDAAFITEIVYGTLRSLGQLDAIIEKAAGRPLHKIQDIVLDILRMGSYQILNMRVDNYAAVNSSVELAKEQGAERAKGMVNGVLRSITRRSPEQWVADISSPSRGDSELYSQALIHSHPRWIASVFNDSLYLHRPVTESAHPIKGEKRESGEDTESQSLHPELADALEADNQRPRVHLAARPGEITAEELALIAGGDEGSYSPYAVYLPHGDPGELEPVKQGLASVQDEGSQLIALSLLRAPVHEDKGRWLDLCAGPGGKTAFIASAARIDSAVVDAIEIAEHRAKLITSITDGLPVRIHIGDGRDLSSIRGLEVPQEGYDRILVDAPCSGLGSLRRRPEARWRKKPEDIPGLTTLQRELLLSAFRGLALGGVVMYSTCTPHPEETTALVRRALDQWHRDEDNPRIEILDTAALLPELGEEYQNQDPSLGVQLWPHRQGTDAMFFIALRKVAFPDNEESHQGSV